MVWGALSLGRVSTALGQPPSGWVESVRLEILDGDSIRTGNQIYRLVGFNAPESGHAQCQRERVLAAKATRRLESLLQAGRSICGASHVLARGARKERVSAIMGGCAPP
jgi:endonuclease YncB( thermonuclease family)